MPYYQSSTYNEMRQNVVKKPRAIQGIKSKTQTSGELQQHIDKINLISYVPQYEKKAQQQRSTTPTPVQSKVQAAPSTSQELKQPVYKHSDSAQKYSHKRQHTQPELQKIQQNHQQQQQQQPIQQQQILSVLPPLQSGKEFTLVLDLDETLIHAFDMIGEKVTFYTRPYCHEFLQQMSRYYEIVIFTAAMQDYADTIIDNIDPYRFVSYRLYRNNLKRYDGQLIKDLDILGRDLSKTLIIDNLEQNYRKHNSNGYCIKDFYGSKSDRELTDLTFLLNKIALEKAEDVRPYIKNSKMIIEQAKIRQNQQMLNSSKNQQQMTMSPSKRQRLNSNVFNFNDRIKNSIDNTTIHTEGDDTEDTETKDSYSTNYTAKQQPTHQRTSSAMTSSVVADNFKKEQYKENQRTYTEENKTGNLSSSNHSFSPQKKYNFNYTKYPSQIQSSNIINKIDLANRKPEDFGDSPYKKQTNNPPTFAPKLNNLKLVNTSRINQFYQTGNQKYSNVFSGTQNSQSVTQRVMGGKQEGVTKYVKV